MENATKALLIAGSILIAILLIAMGVRVFNSTKGTTDQVEGTMQTTEVATFNNKFTVYFGSNKSAAQVKALANVIIANNSTNSQHKVKLKVLTNESTDSASTITTNVANLSGNYTIGTSSDYEGGYITIIIIS